VGQEVVWRAAVLSWVRPGRAADIQIQAAPLVGQGEEVQAVPWYLPE